MSERGEALERANDRASELREKLDAIHSRRNDISWMADRAIKHINASECDAIESLYEDCGGCIDKSLQNFGVDLEGKSRPHTCEVEKEKIRASSESQRTRIRELLKLLVEET